MWKVLVHLTCCTFQCCSHLQVDSLWLVLCNAQKEASSKLCPLSKCWPEKKNNDILGIFFSNCTCKPCFHGCFFLFRFYQSKNLQPKILSFWKYTVYNSKQAILLFRYFGVSQKATSKDHIFLCFFLLLDNRNPSPQRLPWSIAPQPLTRPLWISVSVLLSKINYLLTLTNYCQQSRAYAYVVSYQNMQILKMFGV